MRQMQKRAEAQQQDAILDIINGNEDSAQAHELTEAVSGIYELWALAKMAEHASKDLVLDYLAAAGYSPRRIGFGKYGFSYMGYEVNYTRLKNTVFAIQLSMPQIIDVDYADEETISNTIEYVDRVTGVDVYVEDGYMSAVCRMAPPSEQDTEVKVGDMLRHLSSAASLIRRMIGSLG